jgi:hypothetical protein
MRVTWYTLYIKPGTLLELPPSLFIHEKLTATQCQLSFAHPPSLAIRKSTCLLGVD